MQHFAARLGTRLRRILGAVTAAALIVGSVSWYGAVPAYAETDTTPPAAPAAPTLTPTGVTTDGTVVLTWGAAEADIAYYQIFRYGGSATPAAGDLTYIGRTDTNISHYIDVVPVEGTFHYAIMAVDTAGNASEASDWESITVNLPANGDAVEPDVTAPAAPTDLAGTGAYSKITAVTRTFSASADDDLWRYLVYRSEGEGDAELTAYLPADAESLTDTVSADGSYTYYLVAQDTAGNASAPSEPSSIIVDTTAPVVAISSPAAGQSYARSGTLALVAGVTEAGAGYEESAVTFYLDGQLLAAATLDLSVPAAGAHTVRAQVTDRAGNIGSAEATFTIENAAVSPTAPQNLTGPTYSKSGSVQLSWTAPTEGTVTGYSIYRTAIGALPVLAGTTAAGTVQFTESIATDGLYIYHVVANNNDLASPASNSAVVIVDRVAPAISVASPVSGQYRQSQTLAVGITVTDATSGYDPAQVKRFLNGAAFTGSEIVLSQLAVGQHSFSVEATDRAGNTSTVPVLFTVTAGETALPDAPQNLTAPAFSKSRTVALAWQAPLTGTVTGYNVYRAMGEGARVLVGTTAAEARAYTDTVPADARYSYTVTAVNNGAESSASITAPVTVDTVAPQVTITSPVRGEYAQSGTQAVSVSVTDVTSGYNAADVLLFLDGAAFTGGQINLASLAVGQHSFKVQATDRAGNTRTKTVTFTVTDSDDDDDNDDPAAPEELKELLVSLRSKIHHGHYKSLMAKLQAGKIRNFTLHVIKHRGRFILPAAADKLLKAVGAEDWDIDPRSIKDSEIEGWGNGQDSGKKGNGKR